MSPNCKDIGNRKQDIFGKWFSCFPNKLFKRVQARAFTEIDMGGGQNLNCKFKTFGFLDT